MHSDVAYCLSLCNDAPGTDLSEAYPPTLFHSTCAICRPFVRRLSLPEPAYAEILERESERNAGVYDMAGLAKLHTGEFFHVLEELLALTGLGSSHGGSCLQGLCACSIPYGRRIL